MLQVGLVPLSTFVHFKTLANLMLSDCENGASGQCQLFFCRSLQRLGDFLRISSTCLWVVGLTTRFPSVLLLSMIDCNQWVASVISEVALSINFRLVGDDESLFGSMVLLRLGVIGYVCGGCQGPVQANI